MPVVNATTPVWSFLGAFVQLGLPALGGEQACFQPRQALVQGAQAFVDTLGHKEAGLGLCPVIADAGTQLCGASVQLPQALAQFGMAADQCFRTIAQGGQLAVVGALAVHGAQACPQLFDAAGKLFHPVVQAVGTLSQRFGPGAQLCAARAQLPCPTVQLCRGVAQALDTALRTRSVA